MLSLSPFLVKMSYRKIVINVKRMETGEQWEMDLEDFVAKFKEIQQ